MLCREQNQNCRAHQRTAREEGYRAGAHVEAGASKAQALTGTRTVDLLLAAVFSTSEGS